MEKYDITPILCTEHPLWSLGGLLPNISAMNTWIRESGYLYCDMEQVFLDVDVVTGNPTNENIKGDLYLPDHMHATIEGHQLMFNRFKMDCPYVF